MDRAQMLNEVRENGCVYVSDVQVGFNTPER